MGIFKQNEKEVRIKELITTIEEYNAKKEAFISSSRSLYKKRKNHLQTILKIKQLLNTIENLPKWCDEDFALAISLLNDFNEATHYEKDPLKYVELNDKSGRTSMMIKDAMESTSDEPNLWNSSDAIAVATVIGTSNYGTTADVMMGESATTAALSWLSSSDSFLKNIRDSLGKLGLFLAGITYGPYGWIASLAAYTGYSRHKNQVSISEIERHLSRITDELDLLKDKLNDMKTLINRTDNYAEINLLPSVKWLTRVLPKDYREWDDDQKHKLEQTLNHVNNMANLINERI